MNKGRKLSRALEKTAEINEDIYDLRVILAKLTPKQKDLFEPLIMGHDELEAMILAKQVDELIFKVPVVYDENSIAIKTSRLTIADLSKLSDESYRCLKKIAQDHIQLKIGDINYRGFLDNITWFFKKYALEAGQTLVDIMSDKNISPQTRTVAANSILDRAGYRQRENITAELPVRVIINYPSQPQQIEGEVITSHQ